MKVGPKIVDEGLVFCLDAANPNSYPKSGTTWSDLAGSSSGTLTNGPVFDSANGGIFSFDGSNDYIDTNFDLDFSTADFTLEAWVYPTFDQIQYGRPILTMGTNCASYYFTLSYGRSTNRFSIIREGGPGSTLIRSSSIKSKENWYNVTATRKQNSSDSYTYILYINANQEHSVTGNYYGGTANFLRIGSYTNCNAVSTWMGDISQIKIYDRTLSAPEVLQNYEATKQRFL